MSKILKTEKIDHKKKSFSIGLALLILLAIAVLTYVIFEKSGLWLVEDDDFEHVLMDKRPTWNAATTPPTF